ncbi:MAG: dockerin type I repeat-containing protein [Clostridia bacterium]
MKNIYKIITINIIFMALGSFVLAGTYPKNELPHIATMGFESIIDDQDSAIIKYYATDYFQKEYLNVNDVGDVFTLHYTLDGVKHSVPNVPAGDNSIDLGTLPIGIHTIDLQIEDSMGRKSFKMFNEFKVIDKQAVLDPSKVYIMSDADLAAYNIKNDKTNKLETTLGLQKLFNDKQAAGFKKLVMLKGTYLIDETKTLKVPTEFTLDLNQATLKLNPNGLAGALMIKLEDTLDSHITNGIIEGEWDEHDFTGNDKNSEWVNAVDISGEARYSTVNNVTVKNVTGYGSISGMRATDYTYTYPVGIGGQYLPYGEANSNRYITPDFKDITKFPGFIQVGLYLGYQGNPTGDTFNYIAHFYDEAKQEIEQTNGYFYRRVKYPANAKYVKIEILRTTTTGADMKSLSMFAFKAPENCAFDTVRHEDVRAVGMAISASKNLTVRNCYFTRTGKNLGKCAFDAEDGWDMMQDLWATGNVFENNYNNDFLTAGGHGFVIENTTGKVYMWPRTRASTIRNNTKTKSITYRSDGIFRTAQTRIYNNTVENGVSCSGQTVRNIKAGDSVAANHIIDSELKNVIASGTTAENCTFTYKDFNGYLSGDVTFKSCVFKPAVPAEEYRISLNQEDNNFKFENCTFEGKSRFMAHNSYNTATFKACTFADTYFSPNLSSNMGNIAFDGCTINSSAKYFFTFGPFGYSRGIANVNFKNSTITHQGAGDLIYLNAKPTTPDSKILFDKCNITKTQGNLLSGYATISEPEVFLKTTFLNCTYNPEFEKLNVNTMTKPEQIKVEFIQSSLEVTSSTYIIGTVNTYIKNIVAGTPKQAFLDNIQVNVGNKDLLTASLGILPDGAKVATGMKFKVVSNKDSLVYTLAVKGDANSDSLVNALDTACIKDHILNKTLLANEQQIAGDVNGNGTVNIADMLQTMSEQEKAGI